MDYFHETIKVPEQFLAWVYLQSENCITDVKKHWHRSLEISYIIKGSCLFEINGHELEAHPHDILLINSSTFMAVIQTIIQKAKCFRLSFHIVFSWLFFRLLIITAIS